MRITLSVPIVQVECRGKLLLTEGIESSTTKALTRPL
jgi:hypothetical protein